MDTSVLRLLSFPAVAVALLALALPGAGPAGATARVMSGPAQPAPVGVITTIAGGVGGPALGTRVGVNQPCGVASSGKVYFTESGADLVRRLDPGTGVLGTVAGTGTTGLDGLSDSEPGVDHPCGVAVDAAGNVVFADTGNNRVQVAAARNGIFYGVRMRAGHLYVVAGGTFTHGTPATRASLLAPSVAVDRHGNLVVASQTASSGNGNGPRGAAVVYVVGGATGTFYGQKMVPGGIYAIADSPCASSFCDPGFGGDGGPATAALLGASIPQVAVDASGNVLLVDSGNNRVRMIAESSRTPYRQTVKAGDIYTIAGGGAGGLGDGGLATDATLSFPGGVAAAGDGNVVVSDSGDQRVRLVAAATGLFYGQPMTAGHIYTIAGNGAHGFGGDKGPAVRAELREPASVAIDGAGNVVIADSGNNRVRVVTAKSGRFYGQPMTAAHIYTIAGNGSTGYSGDRGLATHAQLSPFAGDEVNPGGLAVSDAGNVIVADPGNQRVRVVAGANGVFYGVRFTAGHMYTIGGTGSAGFNGDGGPATKANLFPAGVAVDAAGNVLVSDTGSGRVRVIAVKSGRFYGRAMTAGHIYTIASVSAQGLAVAPNGSVVMATFASVLVLASKSGWFYGQKMVAGHLYTLGASLSVAIAVDHAGNLVVAYGQRNVVAVLAVRTGRFYGVQMTAGHQYTVAGDGSSGLSGDGGPAAKAKLSNPAAVAVDSAGNLLIADASNARVRVVAERAGSFYGKKMTAGDIYTVAGSGPTYTDGFAGGFSGDGGPATSAVLFGPAGIAPLGTGLVVLDDRNNRVRAVSG